MKRAGLVGLAALLCFLASAWAEEATPAPPPATAAEAPPPAPVAAASPAASKPETSEPVALEDLAKGDRVLLLMTNGQQFEGHVTEMTPASLRLDFTFSRQKMTGVVAFPRAEVAAVRRLSALTKEEMEAILEKRRQGLLEAQAAWSETVGPAAAPAAKPGGPTAEQKAAEERATEEKQIADYRALLAEFPADQGWGPERLAEIRYRYLMRASGSLGRPVGLALTYQEQRFMQVFDQWSEAKTKVELYEQRQKQEREALFSLFPPEEGWNAAKKQQLEEKQKSGEQLTKLEAQFLKDYDAWQKAVAAKQAEKPAGGQAPTPTAPAASPLTPPAATTPTTTPGPEAPTAPVSAPSAPPAAPPASEAPAPTTPAPESPAPPSPAPQAPGGSEPAKP
jgi:hypothetical protein